MANGRIKSSDVADELRKRYDAGKRDFSGESLYQVDLSQAELAYIQLEGADLRKAKLFLANLRGSNLTDANLAGANLAGANLNHSDLSGANLRSAKLESAQIAMSGLMSSDLKRADLKSADLRRSNLMRANLRDAILVGANLEGADLHDVDLANANLSSANLTGTNLDGANLEGALFNQCLLDRTYLVGVDLSGLCDARSPVRHEGPSHVDHTSIVRSIHARNLKNFLRHSGMHESFVDSAIDTAAAVGANVFRMMRSTFISYGHPDAPFAKKLYEALLRDGVRCFLFSEHAVPGEKLHRTIKKGIAEHDRVILICSRASLDREPVLFEIEEALTREAKMKGESLLIPIRLDRYVLDEWKTEREDIAEAVRSRVVADFEGADQDDDKFQAGLRRLLTALRK